MSDAGRKGFGQQLKEGATPDSQKSTTEKASESLSSTYDSVAGSLQSDGSKSTSQKAGDSLGGNSGSSDNQGSSYLESAQKGLSDTANSVSESLGGKK